MKVVVYRHSVEESNPWLDAFCDGLGRHGIEAARASYEGGAVPADVAVLYGVSQRKLMDRLKAQGTRCLIMEMGYVGDRYRYQSLLWDGLNGRGSHPRAGDGGERWRSLFCQEPMPPWRHDGDYVLIVGQYAKDQSVRHLNVNAWYERTTKQIFSATALPVRFKPHPLSDEYGIPLPTLRGVTVVRGSLDDLLAKAASAVTINSNVGVLAALAGVPVVATDEGAMCWPVASHAVGELIRPDRSDWAHDLAWAQWKKDEVTNGDAWEHLSPALNP